MKRRRKVPSPRDSPVPSPEAEGRGEGSGRLGKRSIGSKPQLSAGAMKRRGKVAGPRFSAMPSGRPGPEAEGRGEVSGSLGKRSIGSEPQLSEGAMEPEPMVKQQQVAMKPTMNQRWIVASSSSAGGEGSNASSDIPMYPRRLPLRCKPYPVDGNWKDVEAWNLEWWSTSKLAKKDPLNYPPILKKPKDPGTAEAVTSPRDKDVILRVARSIVGISSIAPDEEDEEELHFTGIIMDDFMANQRARILTCSDTVCDFYGKLVNRKLLVHLPNKKSIEGQLLFVDPYYDIAMLEISAGIELQGASFVPPEYGEEVFVLARDEESSLMVRHGSIKWLEKPYLNRNHYMFLSCELQECGPGGPVIDKDGNVTGMALLLGTPDPAVLSSSIILKCIDMQSKFSCIARPVHGLELTTVDLLDVTQKEDLSLIGINAGYIVNGVSIDSAAERVGIRRGDVIELFDSMGALSLPELEVSLLSVGDEFLKKNIHSSSKVVFKLLFCDLQSSLRRSVDLPLGFSRSPPGVIQMDDFDVARDVKDLADFDVARDVKDFKFMNRPAFSGESGVHGKG